MSHTAATTTAFGLLNEARKDASARLPSGPSARTATLIGGGAVLVWSTAASLAVVGTSLPPLLFLAGAFAAGFIAFLSVRLARGQSPLGMLAVPLPVLCLLVLGFLGHNGLYVTALRYAPPAEVNLISYLWPLLMVALLGVTGIARATRLQLIGTALGFAGLVWFVSPGTAAGGLLGYALAFGAALCFATYSAFRARVAGGPQDAAGGACGLAAIIAFGLHLLFGPEAPLEVQPTALLAMVLIGVGPMGLANHLWDYGVRFGDGNILSALAYLTPVLSTLLLTLFGLAEITAPLLFGGGLILAGIAVSAAGTRRS